MINGVMNSTSKTHGSTVQFTCYDGYQLIGASSISCNDGKWIESLPRCLGLYLKVCIFAVFYLWRFPESDFRD